MPLHFNNPFGFWLLLGLPVIVAIHFLQQRSRVIRRSALFLLEQSTPESHQGRTWDRLRQSLALWCQLLALLLACWVLVEPRWVHERSTATVVLVLDASASMGAFLPETKKALADKLEDTRGLAAKVTWVLLSSDSRQPVLYRGDSAEQVLAQFAHWRPCLGEHDRGPALRLANSLAGRAGLVWLITDTRENLPPEVAALGVGHPIPNAGFAGMSYYQQEGKTFWRTYVKNHGQDAQQRHWWIEFAGSRTPERKIDLPAGALVELSGPFPEGTDRCVLALDADGFISDDRLPLQRPVSKSLGVALSVPEAEASFFRKLLPTIEGVRLVSADKARLSIAPFRSNRPRPSGASLLLHASDDAAPGEKISVAQRVPVRHPLMTDLNWQAWLGVGAEEMTLLPGDTCLLWQASAPLIVLGGGAPDERSLLFNFVWERSNAEHLPAAVLLVRRYVEQIRNAQAGFSAGNLDCNEPLSLAARDLQEPGSFTVNYEPCVGVATAVTRTLSQAELATLRAPEEPGFFVVRRGQTEVFAGAAQFADPREGDFSQAERFVVEPTQPLQRLLERNTDPDPFEKPALLLLGTCLLLSWMRPGKRGAANRHLEARRS